MSKLLIVLFCIFIYLILFSKSPEFMKCEGLIVPSRGINILAIAWAILWIAPLMLEIIGLWILGRPYNVGIVKWCLMRGVQFFGSLDIS